MDPNQKGNQNGVTLIEMMIGVALLSVGALAFAMAMGNITKSIFVSKTRSLATNLAQEKIESLKNYSYYRLLVTTSAVNATESGMGGFEYDEGYYPPETLSVGNISFTRRVNVQKVAENSGNITTLGWNNTDTGLKLITTHVMWQEGTNWKKVTMTNLRENPNRQAINATFNGTVKSGTITLQGATVFAIENPQLRATSNSSGAYSINVPAGIYNLKTSKSGYFNQVISSAVAANGTATVDFNLPEKGKGTVSGIAYLANHLVISEICAAVDGDVNVEYIEIYNPTSENFTISSVAGAGNYTLRYVRTSDNAVTSLNPNGETIYVRSSIPSNGYFLLASTPTVNGITADAYYSEPTLTSSIVADRIPCWESGGIALVSNGIYETAGSTVDAMGWKNVAGGAPYGPPLALEGSGFSISAAFVNGLDHNQTFERIAYSSSSESDMFIAHSLSGNAYDSNDNSDDWVYHTGMFSEIPQNSLLSETAQTGTPAVGALVFMDDGLSSSATALEVPIAGTFTVTNVATGTWNIVVSSNGYIYADENVIVTQNSNTALTRVVIGSEATGGYASGRVINSAINGIYDILVDAGGEIDRTDSDGYYRLSLAVDTYTITANLNNDNQTYTVDRATGVSINLGEITTVPDITLLQGGILRGFVTTNGTDPLPGIPIVATSAATGGEVASAISDSLGYFQLPDLPIGTYTLIPQLEPGESASPTTISSAVVSGTTVFVGTFTVSNAFGMLEGKATVSGNAIPTGVLVVAVPNGTPIGSDPPTVDSTLRSGSIYYYTGSTDAEGNYLIRLRGGITYNVAAWYCTLSDSGSVSKSQLTSTAVVVAGQSTTKDFTW